MAQHNQVSSTFAASVVPDRQALYGSLLRNQLFVPKLKDQIMTVAFMKGLVGYVQFWVPHCSGIKLLNCADPPTKQEIAVEVVNCMRNETTNDPLQDASLQRTATEIIKHPPNTFWLLAMLSSMNPQHRFFAKDWVKPKP